MKHKTSAVLSLGIALCAASLSASTCSAQPMQRPPAATCAGAYTPAKGGSTRKLIADAMRRSLGSKTGIYAVFNFDWVKASGNWAYAETRPESPDGKSKYEPVWALLRRSNGVWSVKSLIMSGEDSAPETQLRAARRKFPSAPRDIFP